MQNKVEEFVDKWGMLTEQDKVIVGVSGGADSVALLLFLDEYRRKKGYAVHVVHVNHGIRGVEADQDEIYVKHLCEQRNISVDCIHADVPAYVRKHKVSEEEAGRLIRREAFEQALSEWKGTKIALAHHLEDNAETFFMNLARGSKLKGLGGIYPVKGVYIRPLLCVGRNEIEKYLEERGVSYCMDRTNLEDTYMRNRIRNHVLPFFQEQVNRQTIIHVNETMEYLREVQSFLDEEGEKAYEACVVQLPEGYRIEGKTFSQIQPLMKKYVAREVLVRSAGKAKDLEDIHVCGILKLMEMQTGKKLDLPYGLEARKTYEGIIVRKRMEEKSNERILEVSLEDGMSWEYEGMHFHCKIFKKEDTDLRVPKKTFTKWFDYDIIKQNVSVRTKRQGDRMVIDEKGHSKKLKSFFIDEKISSDQRDKIPLLAIKEDILWIVGFRQSKKYQVTEKTKTILEIAVDGGE